MPIGQPILGMSEYEVKNIKYLMFNAGDGNFYKYNGDGTYTVDFGGKKTKLGSVHANTLKTLVQKKLSSKKGVYKNDQDIVDQLNQMAYVMIKNTKPTKAQMQQLEMEKGIAPG